MPASPGRATVNTPSGGDLGRRFVRVVGEQQDRSLSFAQRRKTGREPGAIECEVTEGLDGLLMFEAREDRRPPSLPALLAGDHQPARPEDERPDLIGFTNLAGPQACDHDEHHLLRELVRG